MSKVLGYKSEWHVFTETYLPAGITEDMFRRRQFEDGQLDTVDFVKQMMGSFNNQQQKPPIEEKKQSTNGKTKSTE